MQMMRIGRWGLALVVALISLLAWPPGPAAAFDHATTELEVVEDVVTNAADLNVSLELLEHLATSEVVADGVQARAGARYIHGVSTVPATHELTDRAGAHTLKRALEPPLHRRGIRGT